MAEFGKVEFTVSVDASRVLAVVQAMDMMSQLLKGYGHEWTDEESALVAKAVAACERENLASEPS